MSIIAQILFFIGYLFAGTIASVSLGCVGTILYLGSKLHINICKDLWEDVIDLAYESFDRSLNHIMSYVPDKVRKWTGYEMELY
jgi:hypothetical protein